MARKFVSLNHHSADDYINFDVSWQNINKFYIQQYGNRNFRHASLSTAHFVAYMWMFGNTEWQTQGGMPGIPEAITMSKDYLRAGGGHVFYGMWTFQDHPDDPTNFEQFVNSGCKRDTERWNPWTGLPEPESRQDRCYGLDAAHFYIGDLGEDGRVSPVINWESATDWWAARFCGVERGEFAGSCPFSPVNLEIPDNPLQLPDWLSSYRTDFDETPFYWFCGLLTHQPFKFPATAETLMGPYSISMHLCPIVDDTGQKVWSQPTPAQKFAFIMDWINGTGSQLENVRVGAFLMSKNCKAQRIMPWKPNLTSIEGKEFHDLWSRFQIPPNIIPRQPANLAEARLKPEMINSESCAYGKWKELFLAMLDDMVAYANNHQNVIFFNDRESKDMVAQQYDGTVQVDEARISLIADYLANQDNWQIEESEFVSTNRVTRPPNNAKITISEQTEYYTLSEAWWYMMAALKDLENGIGIQTRILEPIIGPYEPDDIEYSQENSYLIKDWEQHNEMLGHQFQFAYIKKSANILYPNSFSIDKLGPEYTPPDISLSDRKDYRKRVRTWWAVYDMNGVKVQANAAELLWLMAKGLYNYFHSISENVTYLPSHILPKHFNKLNKVRVYPIVNQLSWFDLTQMWTMKPAVLQPAYR